MKIVYILDSLARVGGIERILTDKMNYLADVYGYDVYLITAAQGTHHYSFPLSPKIKHLDIDVRFHLQYQYSYPKRIWIKWHMNRKFKKNLEIVIDNIHPDIIIGTTYYKADVICQLKCNAKKIIESHNAKSYTGINDNIKRNPIIDFFYRIAYRKYIKTIEKKSDVFITLTQGDKDEWGIVNKTYVIPNIITEISPLISSCNNKLVISVGRLTYQKGFERLISTWKMVNKKHPDWNLAIYGTGEEERALRNQIKESRLENVITINPPTPDIYTKMQESSILVFPSRYEGFGLVLIEAMINGVPCISFDCPYGPSDIIDNGNDGYLIPNDNIQKMVDKICYLIENEEIRKEMGKKARKSAMRYAPENIMPLWDKLFNEIVNQ